MLSPSQLLSLTMGSWTMVTEAEGGAATAEFRILGPLVVVSGGTELRIPTRRMRALLVLLLMAPGRPVPAERLIDQLWDGAAPPQAAVTLRSYVSNVRQALGGPDGLGGALVTRAHGYAIDVRPEMVDAFRLGSLATHGREMLRHGRPADALAAFDDAVGLWGGDPLADVADHEAAQGTITQLCETYLGAAEGRFEALLRLGRHHDALPGLEAFVTEHPLREAPHAQLMLALYRSGRAPDALAVHQRFRLRLTDELGIDPSAQLDELLQRILTQDRDLQPPRETTDAASPVAEDPPRAVTEPSRHRPEADPVLILAEPRLVGRDRELAEVGARLDALLAVNSGSLVLLGGEPGIGKTALLDSVQRRARGARVAVHVGRMPAAVTGAPPFWPWTQIVESIAADMGDDELRAAVAGAARSVVRLAPGIADRLGQVLPVTGDSAQALRFLLYEAVSTFIRQATGDRPTVCVLDDIHWADGPSLELLSYITATLGARPLLVLAAYRNLAADRTPELDATLATVSREDTVHEVTVSGLSPQAVESLVFDAPEGALPPITDAPTRESVAAMMHDRTGGNPFFIRQLARLLTESQPATAEDAFVPLPAGVRHVISSRLNALSERTRDLLNAAALIGRDFEVGLTGQVAGLTVEQSLDAYDEAARHGLVDSGDEGGGTRRFTHALVQETLVDGLPRGKAAKLHATIAGQLSQGGRVAPEVLARHMWEARELVGTFAVPSQLAAADSAAQVFAHDQAEEHLRRALDLVTHAQSNPALELQLHLRLYRLIASERGWGDPGAVSLMERARELASPATHDDETVVLWWSLFFAMIDRNDREAYTDVARSLLPLVSDRPPSNEDSTEPRPPDDPDGPRRPGGAASAAIHLMNVLRFLGASDQRAAEHHLREARRSVDAASLAELQAFDENMHVMLLLIEGTWAALCGDRARHESTTGAAIALADADGRPFPRAVARSIAAVSASYLPDPTYGGELARHAAEVNDRYGFSSLATVTGCISAWASAHESRAWDESAREIEDSLNELASAGRLGSSSTLSLLLADLHVIGGRVDEAERILDGASNDPGPYQDLFVAHVVERRRRLLRETGA